MRLRSIDGLRGLAALGVAWFHTYSQNTSLGDDMPKAFSVVSVWGRFGVTLFFVISGFVIAHTLFADRNVNTPMAVGKYFVRRSVRLRSHLLGGTRLLPYWRAAIAPRRRTRLISATTGRHKSGYQEFFLFFANGRSA